MNIEIKNISKSFGSIEANKNINLKLKSGIHALLGENGAGKSTLVKIISGQILPDEGNIFIDNNEVILGSPKNSIEKGIGLLNQDPLDFSNLSIFESFLIGINEKNPYRNINKIRSKIEKLFNNYRVTVDLNSKTNNINNLYKGTPNYNPINHKPTPSVNWFIQLQALMNENPDIAFYKVNDAPIDNNSKVNRRHPQFNEFKNLEYITYKELQIRVDNKW